MAVGLSEMTCIFFVSKVIMISSSTKKKIHNIIHYPTPFPGTGNTIPEFHLVVWSTQQSQMM
jgi:hypothetical protein